MAAGDLIDILDPSSMAIDSIGRQTDELHTTLGEFWLKLGESAELSGADWSVVLWVGEENNPVVANELVEVDGAGSGIDIKVRSDGAQSESVEGVSIRSSSSS